ncbi:N,N-dimethylformamidase beta subunit family domain-containing protein, partial [Sinomonas sp. RB5]
MAPSAALRLLHRFPRTGLRRATAALASGLLVAGTLAAIPLVAGAPPAEAATNPCSPVVSAVACENTLAGDPQSDWMISGAGDSTIQGFATQMSVNAGQTVNFDINTNAKSYHFDILRLGYYQGNGARKIASGLKPSASLPQNQPACQTFSDTGLIDCGNWALSASWTVPSTAVSGVYIAHLVRDDTGGSSWITFVVRNDSSTSAILFQTSDETWQAYNSYGGNSLYSCTVACPPGNPQGYKGAFKVSYNRPFHTALDDNGTDWITYAEMPMIRFMEANGYDMTYQAGLDTATNGSSLLNHKTFVTSGHDEYVSYDQRANIEAARDKGVNIAMFTGNEIFWRTRWEPSQAGPTTSGRTLVCYKDTHFNQPTDPVTWTGTYADPRFGTSGGAGNPQNALSGQFFNVNRGTTDITVPAQYAKLRLWRNTAVANLTGSQSVTLGSGLGTLGYEWDLDADNGFRPAGLFDLSSTTYTNSQVFTDYGTNTQDGQTATHHLTEYRAPSGALVFGAGTVQWSWGLDNSWTGGNTDTNMKQATINLFADMGVQPVTIMSGLVAATASTDTTAPTSAITSPTAGTTVADGSVMTIKGTASDSGGGVVAGVEVSTDGGTTWHPASGTTSWTYSWIAHTNPSTTIRTRAVDDNGNLESSGSGVSVSVNCPCSLFGTNTKPAAADSGDPNAVEVGAQFYSDVAGTVTGVRFYKAGTNTGTHIGNLWTASGTKLASVTFSGESTSGWQSATFSQPVSITAGTKYVISYYAPKGHYTQTSGYFYNNPSPPPAGSDSVDAAPLHFTRSLPSSPNGFYAYSSSSTFPNQIYDAEYYWVDPVFSPAANQAPAVTSTSPSSGATGVGVTVAPSATFNQAVTPSSVTFTLKDSSNNTIAGTSAFNSANTVATFTPSSALAYSTTYTATVSGATNSTGQTMASPYSWSFTTGAPPPAPAVSSTSPASNATGVAVTVAPSATFNQAVTPSSVTFTLKDSGNNTIAGTSAFNSANTVATFTPSSALAYSTTYTATVSGATNSTGQTMAS